MTFDGTLKFPDNFLWGTATAPTQLEGHISNEWTDFKAQDGSTCQIGCDHYRRYAEDVQWMRKLGVNAYRMGIEWSRLQSAPYAPLNRQELERYCDLLDHLKAAGIEPMGGVASFFQSSLDQLRAGLGESSHRSRVCGLRDKTGVGAGEPDSSVEYLQ